MGRFLMKLCCGSEFPLNKDSLANELLRANFEKFQKFSEGLVQIGSKLNRFGVFFVLVDLFPFSHFQSPPLSPL